MNFTWYLIYLTRYATTHFYQNVSEARYKRSWARYVAKVLETYASDPNILGSYSCEDPPSVRNRLDEKRYVPLS